MKTKEPKPRIFTILSEVKEDTVRDFMYVEVEEHMNRQPMGITTEFGDYAISRLKIEMLNDAIKEGSHVVVKNLWWYTTEFTDEDVEEFKTFHPLHFELQKFYSYGVVNNVDDIRQISEDQIAKFLTARRGVESNDPDYYLSYLEMNLDDDEPLKFEDDIIEVSNEEVVAFLKDEGDDKKDEEPTNSNGKDTQNVEVNIKKEAETTETAAKHSVDEMLAMLEESEKQDKEEYDLTKQIAKIDKTLSGKNIANIETLPLNIQTLKKYYMQNATEQEIAQFLQLCAYQGLNPLAKEIYWIKAGGRAYTVVSKDTFLKKANDNPNYLGFDAGIIVKNTKGEIELRDGTFYLKEEELLGGWAEVHRRDRRPVSAKVNFEDYRPKYRGWENGTWGNIPATMIRKVALVQALREAFPEDLRGLYDASEMDQAVRDKRG